MRRERNNAERLKKRRVRVSIRVAKGTVCRNGRKETEGMVDDRCEGSEEGTLQGPRSTKF